jgi:hydrogenase-4 transcriptional activator
MVINKSEFFRETTLRICSSLELHTALERVFRYLREFIPLNQLALCTPDMSNRAARDIAIATDGAYPHEGIFIPLSEDLFEWLLKVRDPFIINHSSQNDDNLKNFSSFMMLKRDSSLSIPLWIEDRLIGSLCLHAKGKDRFTQEHVELLATVAMPFAIILSNALDLRLSLNPCEIFSKTKYVNERAEPHGAKGVIGENSGLHDVMEMVRHVAPQNTTVLIIGETGTGKEVIADAIHSASPRRTGPFMKINCGAIAENLIDDELFGHERGAFTGAISKKQGWFEQANGGTLFLDEIGELPPQSQVRLLRVLQSKMITRVGGEKQVPVDVRIIAATHRNLKEMITQNLFREDLWFRLSVFPISVPPLRQRKGDISLMARHFVTQKCRELGITTPPPIMAGALERLVNYHWPGNVRELENLIERELVWLRGGQVRFDSLISDGDTDDKTIHFSGVKSNYPLNIDEAMSLHIGNVLKMTKGKIHGIGGAAELLGINPNTLRGRLRKLGMDRVRRRKIT